MISIARATTKSGSHPPVLLLYGFSCSSLSPFCMYSYPSCYHCFCCCLQGSCAADLYRHPQLDADIEAVKEIYSENSVSIRWDSTLGMEGSKPVSKLLQC
jgi:hypothetical protein